MTAVPFMLDSHAFDAVAARPDLAARFEAQAAAGLLLATHVQVDEVEAVPDPVRRQVLRRLVQRCRVVPTAGAVVGVSKVDGARVGGDDLPALAGQRMDRNAKDALIAATARLEGCFLVTDDVRLVHRLAAVAPQVPVLSTQEWLLRLGST